jgi:pyridinium-3,5-bisthiocarboxylic acid mononucleotide nickel chelatase
MKLLYLDCFAGISGDMLLGALIDLGVPEETLRAELAKLKLPNYAISTRRVVKQNITATKFACEAGHGHDHRGYTEIAGMIDGSSLPVRVKQRSLRVFKQIGEAEAKIHGVPLDRIHFHEIGAVDSIVDIVGSCIALEVLGADEVHAASPPLGSGFVETAHGRFPIPAPATLEILKGVPTQSSPVCGELVTPTGAALLVEFAMKFGPMPAMQIEKIGYGAGSRELDATPNVLRAVLGTANRDDSTNIVSVIETNIDDMNPQWFGDLMERLLVNGALDVFLTSVQMKKNRPGTLVTVLCETEDVGRFTEMLLAHTTSFGVRVHETRRRLLQREIVNVKTDFGEIQVKIGRLEGKILTRTPEYESCRKAANLNGVTIKEVYAAAQRGAEELK